MNQFESNDQFTLSTQISMDFLLNVSTANNSIDRKGKIDYHINSDSLAQIPA